MPSRVAVLDVTAFAAPGEVVHSLQDLLPLLLVAALPEVSSSASPSPSGGGGIVRVQNHALAADSIGGWPLHSFCRPGPANLVSLYLDLHSVSDDL